MADRTSPELPTSSEIVFYQGEDLVRTRGTQFRRWATEKNGDR